MWRLVPALALIGTTLVAALPAAQNEAGGLGDLIDQVYGTSTTPPPTVPPIGGDDDLIGGLIKEVFNNNTSSNGLILGKDNQQPVPQPGDCECVPYYQCKEGTILESGIGIIDIRSGDKEIEQPQG